MGGPTDSPLNAMLGARGRPRSLEEAKLMFRVSVGSASMTGPLRYVQFNAKRLTAIAFGVGLALGAFPSARRALGQLIQNALAARRKASPLDDLDGMMQECAHRRR